MKFSTDRATLLRALSMVSGVVERPQQTQAILPVLSHLLFDCNEGGLSITGTDLEVELNVRIREGIEVEQPGRATLPGRKLAEIWRSLPEDVPVTVEMGDQATVRSGRSRFVLATLPTEEYPDMESAGEGAAELSVAPGDLRRLLAQTSFAMAQQDVRYYLNGLLLEVTDAHIRAVATDGHRLAMCTLPGGAQGADKVQAIIPRKGVVELGRLLADAEGEVELSVGTNSLRASHGGYALTMKLVEGQYPDYIKVIPEAGARQLSGDRDTLRQSFQRAAIIGSDRRSVAPLVRLAVGPRSIAGESEQRGNPRRSGRRGIRRLRRREVRNRLQRRLPAGRSRCGGRGQCPHFDFRQRRKRLDRNRRNGRVRIRRHADAPMTT